MAEESQNALLKTLEEPAPFAHLILITRRARGAARDRALALPARSASRRWRRAVEAELLAERAPGLAGGRARAPPPGWPAATSSGPRAPARRAGPRAARGGRRRAPAPRAPAELGDAALGARCSRWPRRAASRPVPPRWTRRERWPRRRAETRARLPRRREREAEEAARAPRAGRGPRRSTWAWGCSAAWLRDLAAVAEGRRSWSWTATGSEALAEDAEGLDGRAAPGVAAELVMDTRRRLHGERRRGAGAGGARCSASRLC